MSRQKSNGKGTEPYDARTTAFLLTQVGSNAGAIFAGKVADLGVTTAQVGILMMLTIEDGVTQSALSRKLGVVAARTVVLVDDLERNGLVARTRTDRRSNAIHLTEAGKQAIKAISMVAKEHDKSYLSVLSSEEKLTLRSLLEKIAVDQQLSPNSPACKPVMLTAVKRPRPSGGH